MAKRVLGIDYGTKRVGLAIADPLGMFAQPLNTCSPDEALSVVEQIQADEGVECVVVGWPLLEDGTEGRATERVQQYINRVRKLIPDAEIVKWDERNTTTMAKEMIRSGAKPSLRTAGRGRIDTAAAGIILQQYLDEQT